MAKGKRRARRGTAEVLAVRSWDSSGIHADRRSHHCPLVFERIKRNLQRMSAFEGGMQDQGMFENCAAARHL